MEVGIALPTILAGVLEILLVHALNVNPEHVVAGQDFATIRTRIRPGAVVVNLLVLVQRLSVLEGFATVGAVEILHCYLVHVPHMAFKGLAAAGCSCYLRMRTCVFQTHF